MNSSQKLRITHIDTGLTLRGGQRQMLMLAQGLRERGHEQIIICVEGSELQRVVSNDGFQHLTLPPFDPWHAFGVQLWRQQIKARAPQLIHAHDGRGQSIAWTASVGLAVRRVASRRVTFFPSDGWTYRLKYTYTCDAVVTVSENIRTLSIDAGVPAPRIVVIPDGIEIPSELPKAGEREQLRALWGFGEKYFVVGLLGASSPEKGHDVAASAFELLQEKLPQARLVLAGDESALATSNLIEQTSGLKSGVVRVAPIRNLSEFFPGLDLFIMPSRSEGLGSSALWAMAYGVPVVATRVGGLPEIVADGETGWLIPPDSAPALAEGILHAASDRATLAAYGQHGRKRAEGFSAATMVQRTEELYYRLLSGESL